MSVESMNATSSIASAQPAAAHAAQPSDTAGVKNIQPVTANTVDVNPQQEMTADEMQAVVDKLNEFMHNGQRNLNFSVDRETDETVIKVMNSETQEVIRQFPSEEALKLTQHIEGMMGLIFNDRA
jgi:flagellar protein FlaG